MERNYMSSYQQRRDDINTIDKGKYFLIPKL